MKVIFLDIDGVINTCCPIPSEGRINFGSPTKEIIDNKTAMSFVEALCKISGAKIVVSSSWRIGGRGKEFFNKLFKHNEMDVDVIGVTPYLNGVQRGIEIQLWLDDHPEVEEFVILDDDSDMKHLMGKLVKCNSSYGFMINEYIKACDMLKVNENRRYFNLNI